MDIKDIINSYHNIMKVAVRRLNILISIRAKMFIDLNPKYLNEALSDKDKSEFKFNISRLHDSSMKIKESDFLKFKEEALFFRIPTLYNGMIESISSEIVNLDEEEFLNFLKTSYPSYIENLKTEIHQRVKGYEISKLRKKKSETLKKIDEIDSEIDKLLSE